MILCIMHNQTYHGRYVFTYIPTWVLSYTHHARKLKLAAIIDLITPLSSPGILKSYQISITRRKTAHHQAFHEKWSQSHIRGIPWHPSVLTNGLKCPSISQEFYVTIRTGSGSTDLRIPWIPSTGFTVHRSSASESRTGWNESSKIKKMKRRMVQYLD